MKIKTLILLSSIFSCTVMANPTDVASSSGTNQATSPVVERGEVRWRFKPKINLRSFDLKGMTRNLIVKVDVNERGRITKVHLLQSTGLPALDRAVINATYGAAFYPRKINDKASRFTAEIPFSLSNEGDAEKSCRVELNSNIVNMQRQKQATKFIYIQQPTFIIINKIAFSPIQPEISVSLKMKKNQVTLPIVRIIKGSGNAVIDKEIQGLLQNIQVKSKKTWFPFFKMKASDQITLDVSDCQ